MNTAQGPDNSAAWLLEKGERVLWAGMPARGNGLGPRDIIMIPFSLAWAGFAFFWEYSTVISFLRTGSWIYIVFMIFGSVFVLAGIYLVIGRFFFDAYAAKRTFYAVTDRRVMIRRDYFPKRLQSLIIDRIGGMELAGGKGNLGSITFGRGTYSTSYTYNNPGFYNPATGIYQPMGGNTSYYNPPPGFYNIENASTVHRLILKQMKKEPAKSPDNLT